jgi:large subunit ribosomal protein L6
VTVRGANDELTNTINPNTTVKLEDNQLIVTRNDDSKPARSAHGLQRSLLANMVQGVSEGFKKVLELHGVGFRAQMQGATLKLGVGFSHDVEFEIPAGVTATVDGTTITVSGSDKQLVGQVAARIREVRKPEPYKGKGIRYQDEYIIRKAGKAAATGGAG